MSLKLKVEQYNLLKKIIHDEEIKNYELEVASGAIKGDNYMGLIITVTVRDKNRPRVLNLILKAATPRVFLKDQSPVVAAYNREIYMYDKVFPAFKCFQEETIGKEVFKAYPKYFGCYAKEGSETLVLENLKSKGFQLFDRKERMNHQHISFVFREYAKYHAVSLAMKTLQKEKFEGLIENLGDIFKKMDMAQFSFKKIFQRGSRFIKDQNAKKALENIGENIMNLIENMKLGDKTYWIINHGDNWCNNFLFKYGDDINEPKEVNFIDFQMTQYSPPTSDLVNFFYASGTKEMFFEFEKYLQIYHNELSQTLQKFGLTTEKIYPFEALMTDWRKYSKVGILVSIMVINLMLKDVDEVTDFQKIEDQNFDVIAEYTADIRLSEEYGRRINDIVMFQYEKGFLSIDE